MSRSASYFESGTGRGMGFRDSCQDLLGFVHIIPARARERILDIAVAFLGQGLVLVVGAAILKLGGGDIQNALPCAGRNDVYKAQQILTAVAEAHRCV